MKSTGKKTTSHSRHHQLGLNIIGFISGGFGLAQVPRYFLQALLEDGMPFALKKVQITTQAHQKDSFRGDRNFPYPFNLFFINAEFIREWRIRAKYPKRVDQYDIGVWFWELEHFPAEYRTAFNEFDEIWVFSEFIQQTLAAVSPIPVILMPFPYSPPPIDPFPAAGNQALSFLHIFDFWSDIQRKNPHGVVEAFRRAFPAESQVRLVIKTINGQRFAKDLASLTVAMQKDSRITLIDRTLGREDFWRLFCQCDCFVSLHRAEGLGLNILDAIHLEKPVIATAYGGSSDFLDPELSYLVDYRMIPIQTESYFYHGRGHWAEPDLDMASRQMIEILANPAAARNKALLLKQSVFARHNPANAMRAVRIRLDTLSQSRLTVVSKKRPAPAVSQLYSWGKYLAQRAPQTILIFYTARRQRVLAIIRRLRHSCPQAKLFVFGKADEKLAASADRYFVYRQEGFYQLASFSARLLRSMTAVADLAVIPFFNSYGDNYGNVFTIVRALKMPEAFGIGIADDVLEIDVKALRVRPFNKETKTVSGKVNE